MSGTDPWFQDSKKQLNPIVCLSNQHPALTQTSFSLDLTLSDHHPSIPSISTAQPRLRWHSPLWIWHSPAELYATLAGKRSAPGRTSASPPQHSNIQGSLRVHYVTINVKGLTIIYWKCIFLCFPKCLKSLWKQRGGNDEQWSFRTIRSFSYLSISESIPFQHISTMFNSWFPQFHKFPIVSPCINRS